MYNIRPKKDGDLNCKYCNGILDLQFNKKYAELCGQLRGDKTDQAIEEHGNVYCNRLCAKAHWKEMLKNGEIKEEAVAVPVILKDKQYTDLTGEPVYFPADGRPYFDVGLQRTFNNIQEKTQFLREHRIVHNGSMDGPADKRKRMQEEASYNARMDVLKRDPAKLERVERSKRNGKIFT